MDSSCTTTLGDRDFLKAHCTEKENFAEVTLAFQSDEKVVLHWGLSSYKGGPWLFPSSRELPANTSVFNGVALRTDFDASKTNQRSVTVTIPCSPRYKNIHFSLYYPDKETWDNNHGKNYHLVLPHSRQEMPSVLEIIKKENQGTIIFEKKFELEEGEKLGVIYYGDSQKERLCFCSTIPGDLTLHWGVASKRPKEWIYPPGDMVSPETVAADSKAAQTPFEYNNELNVLQILFPENENILGVPFVLTQKSSGKWFKNKGKNFYIPLRERSHDDTLPFPSETIELIEEIIDTETDRSSWTLMHRFNMCHDLLDSAKNDLSGLAAIFVWLRFSSIRQLDWQRSYNTQPRDLSHAQDRLTLKLAEVFVSKPECRDFVRLIFTTVGPGGEGQKIRDEILNIMHRHHIKEVSGHFMEEWHQKLHNNTTPDDIVICQGYLEFLRSNGNVDHFYATLKKGGVTRKRLESFDRPIRTEPDFVPHLKDALIYDFENYLKLFKSVHSGADLDSAINGARGSVDHKINHLLTEVWHQRDNRDIPVFDRVALITDVRGRLHAALNTEGDKERVRTLLYLDLALEEHLRVVLEGNLHLISGKEQLLPLIQTGVTNFKYQVYSDELRYVANHWAKLQDASHAGKEWALNARSVTERVARILSSHTDEYYQLLQPCAEYMGNAFGAEDWTIKLFSEEVLRGRFTFVLSMLLHKIDPILRKAAHFSSWQIISQGKGIGALHVVEDLSTVQETTYKKPIILVAKNVSGDEDIPDGVTAVITPSSVDIVSHVAVRVRNSNVLFASCYEESIIEELSSKEGIVLSVSVSPSGEVCYKETTETGESDALLLPSPIKITSPTFTAFSITESEFTPESVGNKSRNLTALRGKIPAWVGVPAGIAIPFRVFEKVLEEEQNKTALGKYRFFLKNLPSDPKKNLALLRTLIENLPVSKTVLSALDASLKSDRIYTTADPKKMWACIRSVWSSLWSERAHFSRKKTGMNSAHISMAVLIQEIIEPEYAFVLHTVNPSTQNRDEIFGELVLGLGETLVGNYPGRALSFSVSKKSGKVTTHSLPEKSVGLFGKGLIFRSDSNAEDLEHFAGAGLYESIPVNPPIKKILDYTNDPLVWDKKFRENFLKKIGDIGKHIEKISGTPQDIEGVYSKGELYVVQTRAQAGALKT